MQERYIEIFFSNCYLKKKKKIIYIYCNIFKIFIYYIILMGVEFSYFCYLMKKNKKIF